MTARECAWTGHHFTGKAFLIPTTEGVDVVHPGALTGFLQAVADHITTLEHRIALLEDALPIVPTGAQDAQEEGEPTLDDAVEPDLQAEAEAIPEPEPQASVPTQRKAPTSRKKS